MVQLVVWACPSGTGHTFVSQEQRGLKKFRKNLEITDVNYQLMQISNGKDCMSSNKTRRKHRVVRVCDNSLTYSQFANKNLRTVIKSAAFLTRSNNTDDK